MEIMEIWWQSLSGILRVLWGIAIFSTCVFSCQTLLTLVGGSEFDNSHDVDCDSDGDNEQSVLGYFTIRNMVSFLLGFSWGSIACLDNGLSTPFSVSLGSFIGIMFTSVSILIFKGLSKLTSDGSLSLQNAIGKTGTTTIRIPKHSKGQGKVSVVFQGKMNEIEAITEGEEIKRSRQVKVVAVSGSTLVVIAI